MTFTDETLMAFVDGELDADTRVAVEQALSSDPELARRIARTQALRQRIRAAYDGVLDEPIPERLLAAIRGTPGEGSEPKVADLSRKRAEKTARVARRWSMPQRAAVAASLVLGVLLGHLLWRPDVAGQIVAREGRLIAQDVLAEALASQLASAQAIDARVGIGLSFRSKSGNYCRTFILREGGGLAGLACRERDAWTVQVVAPGARPVVNSAGYRMAATDLPLLVLQAVEERMDGDPLDAQEEEVARRNGWR